MITSAVEPEPKCAPRFEDVFPVADAVLFEGYALYPYRPSSLKNRVRWNFGGVYPRGYSQAQTGTDSCEVFTECLIRGSYAQLTIEARFLELIEQPSQAGCEAAEPRSFRCELGSVASLVAGGKEHSFTRGRLFGCVEVTALALSQDLFRVRVSLRNESNNPAIERAAAFGRHPRGRALDPGCSDGRARVTAGATTRACGGSAWLRTARPVACHGRPQGRIQSGPGEPHHFV
jgi:hypothetical protein